MTKLVIFRRCATIEEALIVSSLLQDGGFYHSLGEYYVSNVQWDALAAFGGVSIWMPESELLPAGQYLLDMRKSAADRLEVEFGAFDTAPLKLRWGRAWSMLIIYSGLSYLIFIALLYILAALPIDWVWLINGPSNGNFYAPVVTASSSHSPGFSLRRPEGLLYVAIIVLLLFVDITGVRERKRLSGNSSDQQR